MKRTLLYGSGILLVLILALGAFVGMRLLTTGEIPGLPRGLGHTSVTLEKAEELPQEEPDLVGIFVRREDNSLVVGTGNITFHSYRESETEPFTFEKGYDGPQVEVVTTHATLIYYDVTGLPEADPETGQVKQVLREGTLDELGQDHLFQVWGERQGDRIVAHTLVVYSPPGG
jgi:hypothetical protein